MYRQSVPAASDGFVPLRLVIARNARGLKQNELAERLEIAPGTLSKWESESYASAPDAEALSRLSCFLDIRPQWFYKPVELAGTTPFYRSMKSALNSARNKLAAKLRFVDEIQQALDQWVEFPRVDLPDLMKGRDYRHLRAEDIDEMAFGLREYWGIGEDPVDDVLLLIENAGVAVAEDFVESVALDGVSQWIADRPVMLLAKDKDGGVRRRFDAAHELGHLILHKNTNINDITDNLHLIEEQAMVFAGAFLLPGASFISSMYDVSLDSLADIKPTWKVSVAAMIKRARVLNLISGEHERNLWKYYSYRRWRGDEPHDESIDIEKPMNLRNAIEVIVDEDPRNLPEALDSMALSTADIERLTGATLPTNSRERNKPKLRIVGGSEC